MTGDQAQQLLDLSRETRWTLARPLAPAMDQAPLHMCAQAHRAARRLDAAAARFTESLELNRRLGDVGMVGVERHNLGHVELHRGNTDGAERCFEECARGGSNDDFSTAMNPLNAASIACARGDAARATTLLAQAEASLSTGVSGRRSRPRRSPVSAPTTQGPDTAGFNPGFRGTARALPGVGRDRGVRRGA